MTSSVIAVALFAAGALFAAAYGHLQLRDLRAAHERERAEWARERGLLLNRIKPETAQPVDGELAVPVEAVSEFSDEEYWAVRGVAWRPGDGED